MLVRGRHRLVVAGLGALVCLVAAALPLAAQSTGDSPAATTSTDMLTSADLDALVAAEHPAAATTAAGDEQYLRRVSFDLLGRPPTLDERRQFLGSNSPRKDRELVERLLARQEFGANWADYWRDTIAFHIPPPELTYLNYEPLRRWLAERLNSGAPWDAIVRDLITASGQVDEHPAATFIGYHQAEATNLAAETSRIFLGQQIGCAQCHDHPFDSWKRTQFHQFAAFFARTRAKLSQNDGGGTLVMSHDKGEYLLPDQENPLNKGVPLQPAPLDGQLAEIGKSDADRRARLAAWVASRENRWFALAYTNRIWARLMGRGFYEPVDDLGDSRPRVWSGVHQAIARHFAASGFDVKGLFRLVMQSESYRVGLQTPVHEASSGALAEAPLRLRGDEVFAALAVGIDLPNVTPQAVKPTAAVRFPPPPKSTRDLVREAFAADPSLSSSDTPRTIGQALWMMNNEQLQAQLSGAPGSGTMLVRLLEAQPDDRLLCEQLFERVLARAATREEVRIALEHVADQGDRRVAFEDVLWGLVNSAEFSTRR
jgi:hypothetical protein